MGAPVRVRDEQRAASESAILTAATALVAAAGPDATSLRDVGAAAGCTHALVSRYFGSKAELVDAVAARSAARVDERVGRALTTADDPVVDVLGAARSHPPEVRLLVRTALGDLPSTGFPGCLHLEWLLPATGPASRGVGPPADRRSRMCAYAAASLLLGFVTFEGFLVAATRLGPLAPRRRDLAVAAAARHVLDVAAADAPRLRPRDLAARGTARLPREPLPETSADALLAAAIELFAARGPASVPVREIARRAGVNQGLIYRHFGSKEALLAAALEQGSSGLFPAALAPDGVDFDAMSWLVHHASPAPRLIARTLVDDVDITRVRRSYPVLRQLLAGGAAVPAGAGPADLSDPRVAVLAAAAMALGSAIWGGHLRRALLVAGDGDGVDSAIADLARHLVAIPSGAAPGASTTA